MSMVISFVRFVLASLASEAVVHAARRFWARFNPIKKNRPSDQGRFDDTAN